MLAVGGTGANRHSMEPPTPASVASVPRSRPIWPWCPDSASTWSSAETPRPGLQHDDPRRLQWRRQRPARSRAGAAPRTCARSPRRRRDRSARGSWWPRAEAAAVSIGFSIFSIPGGAGGAPETDRRDRASIAGSVIGGTGGGGATAGAGGAGGAAGAGPGGAGSGGTAGVLGGGGPGGGTAQDAAVGGGGGAGYYGGGGGGAGGCCQAGGGGGGGGSNHVTAESGAATFATDATGTPLIAITCAAPTAQVTPAALSFGTQPATTVQCSRGGHGDQHRRRSARGVRHDIFGWGAGRLLHRLVGLRFAGRARGELQCARPVRSADRGEPHCRSRDGEQRRRLARHGHAQRSGRSSPARCHGAAGPAR